MLLALAVSVIADAEGLDFDPSRIPWEELDFRAKKLGVVATTDVRLKTVAPSQATSALIEPGGAEGVKVDDSQVVLLGIGSRLMGLDSEVNIWLNPDGSALQRNQISTSNKVKRNRDKTNRYTPRGVYSLVRRPTESEVGRPSNEWSAVTDRFHGFPDALGADDAVTEPAALFYILSAANLKQPGDKTRFYSFSKKTVLRVELVVEEISRIKVEYDEISKQGGKRTIQGEVDALRISVGGAPVGPEAAKSDFQFLGLHGDIELFLDRQTRVLLQATGRINGLGKGRVRLQRAVLK